LTRRWPSPSSEAASTQNSEGADRHAVCRLTFAQNNARSVSGSVIPS
jgi:hypothetical protein